SRWPYLTSASSTAAATRANHRLESRNDSVDILRNVSVPLYSPTYGTTAWSGQREYLSVYLRGINTCRCNAAIASAQTCSGVPGMNQGARPPAGALPNSGSLRLLKPSRVCEQCMALRGA